MPGVSGSTPCSFWLATSEFCDHKAARILSIAIGLRREHAMTRRLKTVTVFAVKVGRRREIYRK
ncbi:MAG TPA: hypothetical protein VLE73_02435 [Candidatus Saccharimonadales bacterium]|nr:hypothetical protein [Candidatus Saccharimonadales bacterium]